MIRVTFVVGAATHRLRRTPTTGIEGRALIKSFTASTGSNVSIEMRNGTEVIVKESNGSVFKIGELSVDESGGYLRSLETYSSGNYEVGWKY